MSNVKHFYKCKHIYIYLSEIVCSFEAGFHWIYDFVNDQFGVFLSFTSIINLRSSDKNLGLRFLFCTF